MLAEPEVQNFLAQIDKGVRGALQKGLEKDADQQADARDLYDAARIVLAHPTAIFVSNLKLATPPEGKAAGPAKASPPALQKMIGEIEAGVVVSLGKDAAPLKALIDNYLARYLKRCLKKDVKGTHAAIGLVQINGQTWQRIQVEPLPPVTWGFDGDYFIAAAGPQAVEKILARMKAAPPKWCSSIREQVPIERRSTVTYLNVRGLIEVGLSLLEPEQRSRAREAIEALGLANATALVDVSGLEGEYYVEKTLLGLDGGPRGLLRLVSDRPLRREDLAPIPRDATLAMAVRLDLQEAMEIVRPLTGKAAGPHVPEATGGALEGVASAMGIDLGQSVLRLPGDTWRVYNSPGEGGFILTGLTVVVPLREGSDPARASSRLKALVEQWLAPHPADSSAPSRSIEPSPTIERFRFQGHDVYCAKATAMGPLPCVPAWCITEQEIVFALSAQNVKAYLSHGAEHEPLDRLPQVGALFSNGNAPAMVAFCDSRRLLETFYPLLTLSYGPVIAEACRSMNLDVDMSLLPSYAAIGRHMLPGTLTVGRTKHGVEMVARGTIPYLSLSRLMALSVVSSWNNDVFYWLGFAAPANCAPVPGAPAAENGPGSCAPPYVPPQAAPPGIAPLPPPRWAPYGAPAPRK